MMVFQNYLHSGTACWETFQVLISLLTHETRPFLYPAFTYAHRKIENELKVMEEGQAGPVVGAGNGNA